jgi:hypothetical protein
MADFEVRLSATGLSNISDSRVENNFKFVVGDTAYRCHLRGLSPKEGGDFPFTYESAVASHTAYRGRRPEPFVGFIPLKLGLFDEFENEPSDPNERKGIERWQTN